MDNNQYKLLRSRILNEVKKGMPMRDILDNLSLTYDRYIEIFSDDLTFDEDLKKAQRYSSIFIFSDMLHTVQQMKEPKEFVVTNDNGEVMVDARGNVLKYQNPKFSHNGAKIVDAYKWLLEKVNPDVWGEVKDANTTLDEKKSIGDFVEELKQKADIKIAKSLTYNGIIEKSKEYDREY